MYAAAHRGSTKESCDARRATSDPNRRFDPPARERQLAYPQAHIVGVFLRSYVRSCTEDPGKARHDGSMAIPTVVPSVPSNILNAKILIADNQESNVLLLQRMLVNEGYTCIAISMESSKVCELHRRNRYDLILLDLRMPGMDGFEVMEGLKKIELQNDLPVLVVTAQPDLKERAILAGAKDFIDKPFNRVEVLTRVRNLLEIRLLQDALRKAIAG
jgi:CheY-like chemotaxis protein